MTLVIASSAIARRAQHAEAIPCGEIASSRYALLAVTDSNEVGRD
jgi:hypothetical protein